MPCPAQANAGKVTTTGKAMGILVQMARSIWFYEHYLINKFADCAGSGRRTLTGNSGSSATPYFQPRMQAHQKMGLTLRRARWFGMPDVIASPPPPDFTFCRTLDPPVVLPPKTAKE
jgi:hypothetical protein